MPVIKIRHCGNGSVLFAGLYPDLRGCAEAAIAQGYALDHADFAQANLTNAALDGGSFRHASFEGANLTGANLSEARLESADFTGATLHNACLCAAELSFCRFTDAGFGATDIAGAYLQSCIFSTLSSFTLDFANTAHLEKCVYLNPDGKSCEFSRPPVVVGGLEYPVALFDNHIKAGSSLRDLIQWLDTTNDNTPHEEDERALCGFLQRYREALLFLGAARLPHYREAAPPSHACKFRACASNR